MIATERLRQKLDKSQIVVQAWLMVPNWLKATPKHLHPIYLGQKQILVVSHGRLLFCYLSSISVSGIILKCVAPVILVGMP